MLSMGTVFHEIILKKPERSSNLMDIEEQDEEEELSEPEMSKEAADEAASDNSDEDWDTDLEDTGKILILSQEK